MKRYIRAAKEEDSVDLYAKTVDGDWVKIFENIPESKAIAIWEAGFASGQRRFSVRNAESARVEDMNRKVLGK